MKIVIDIPDAIFENIKMEPDNMCDSFIMGLIRVHDMSAVKVFRAIKNGTPLQNPDEFFRNPTETESASVHNYIDEISIPTGVNMFDFIEKTD